MRRAPPRSTLFPYTTLFRSQAVGQVPVDVKAAGVDVLMAGGLKWLLGGPGIVFLYVREELAPRLAPAIAGWFGHRNQFAFDPHALELHDDARRFELGTPSLAAVYAQLGGLDYIDEIGVPAIRAVTGALAEDLIARARERGFRPKVAARAADRSRSEEHTSELQSHHDLVCRLLLEKKK